MDKENFSVDKDFLKENQYLVKKLWFVGVWVVSLMVAFGWGRSSKQYVLDEDGDVKIQNTFLGDIFCNVLERSKLLVLTGRWQPVRDAEEFDMTEYRDVFYLLQDEERGYIDQSKLDADAMLSGSIKGLVDSLGDPYSFYLNAEETKEYNKMQDGTYEGIGAELDDSMGYLRIDAVYEDSPAKKSGLKKDDVIMKVDGTDIVDMDVNKAVMLIRGEKGTIVVLNIYRSSTGKSFDVSITRDRIESTINYIGKIDNISVVKISRFTETQPSVWNGHWDSIINQVVADNPEGIIFDLRSNPGGYLASALYALDDIVPKGEIKMKVKDRSENISDVTSIGTARLAGYPIVVLIDDSSASAAEIFAGSLQKNNLAYVIGTDSYGKGSVQDVYALDSGASIHLTIEYWLLPDGQHLDKENTIIPDEKVDYNDETEGDDQLECALQYLQTNN